MSMLDGFFSKGSFKGSKCKTLLKLTIPRIKLLRNRREIHIKQMRRDIAKLLETGQEATARIRVEHIIREEKMMAAQEIIELFCELVVVRLPIIEAQRECPLDLKEAISSLCFAAPRCADLPELIQVQMSFAGKYGKEFVAAATELMPECGVNRQLIEHLSVRAPAPDVKLKLLKEIAEEHELDWDPTASETELLKPHEDLLNGPSQFVSGSALPLPQEKHEEPLPTASEETHDKQADSDEDFDILDFPEVPNSSVQPTAPTSAVSRPEMLPFPDSALSDLNDDVLSNRLDERLEKSATSKSMEPDASMNNNQEKQFLPFISPPSVCPPPAPTAVHRQKSDVNVDLQDVVAAAHAAAESAERAAAAARSAASLAQVRISELVKKQNEYDASNGTSENAAESAERAAAAARAAANLAQARISEFTKKHNEYDTSFKGSNENPFSAAQNLDPLSSSQDDDGVVNSFSHPDFSPPPHQPQRLSSTDDILGSYPNLFSSRSPGDLSRAQSFADNPRSSDEL